MKKLGRMEYVTRLLVTTLCSLSLVILLAGTSQAALNCTSCHGNGTTDSHPVDTPFGSAATYRNITTGAVKGNHNTHFSATATGTICTKCHGAAAATYTNNHAVLKHYSIQMAPSVNYNKGAGVVTAFPQSSSPVLGTCSTVNCHFQTITPTWGGVASFASQKTVANADASATCTKCHVGSTALPLGTGKHSVHNTKYATGDLMTACVKCHPAFYALTGSAAFTHATSSSTSIVVTFANAPLGTGTVANLRTAGTFLPGAATASAATCSATYCHKGAPTTPAWNAAATNCTSCHDAVSTTLAGRHDKHISATAATSMTGADVFTTNYAFGCIRCHPSDQHVLGQADTNAPVQDAAVGGVATRITTYTKGTALTADARTYSSTAGSCATSCHTKDGVTAGSAVVVQNWGTVSTNTCVVCHKASGETYATMVGNGAAALSAKHNLHMANDRYGLNTTNYTCATCHAVTATNNTTINGATGRAIHTNANRDVSMTAFATGAAVTIGGSQGSQTCSNTYCHSNGTIAAGTHAAINWTSGTVAADCSSCHGGNATAATRVLTNVHAQHLFSSARVGRTVGCKDCHYATVTVATDRTVASYTNHVDKNVNVKFDNAAGINKDSDAPTYGTSTIIATGAAKAAGSTITSCANLYCHSVGNLGTSGNLVNAGGAKFKTAAWNGGALTCAGCHGDGATKSYPVYVSLPAQAGYSSSNSHVKHVESSSLGCDYCHYNTVTQTSINPTQVRFNDFSGHLNRQANVRFKLNAGKTGVYNPGNLGATTKTCSATYCHGATASPAWGGSTTCASCHDSSNTGLSTRHDKHYNSASIPSVLAGGTDAHTTTTYVYACLNCHPTATHATGPADAIGPVFQDAQVSGTKMTSYTPGASSATDTKLYNYTVNGTCSTVCHTKDGVTAGSAVVAANWSGASTGGCAVCHRGPETSALMTTAVATNGLTVAHVKHMATDRYGLNTNFTCGSCHNGTALNNTALQATVQARTQHPNALKELAMNAFATGGTVVIAGAQGAQTCSNTYCHSNGTLAAGTHAAVSWTAPAYSTCAECHGNKASITTGSHGKHVNLAGVTCASCHNTTASSDTVVSSYTNHVNENVTINFNAAAASNAAATYNGQTAGGATTYQKGIATPVGSCATTVCHGSTASANWGVSSGNNSCTLCHGTGTVTVTAANYEVVAPSGTNSDTGQVSTGTIGAHQTHLKYFNGVSAQGADPQARCQVCHTIPGSSSHANGLSTPVFSGLALGTGTFATSYSAGTCAVYCHNPTGTGGVFAVGNAPTVTTVSWTNAAYIADGTLKTQTNCNKCHKVPGDAGFTFAAEHGSMTTTTAVANNCIDCHGHEGGVGGAVGQQHMDGIRYAASSSCDGCHNYDTEGVAPNKTWGSKNKNYSGYVGVNEAIGAHAKHIEYLKTRWTLPATLDAAGDNTVGYGAGNAAKVCGVCHTNIAGNHKTGDRMINFGDGTQTVNGIPMTFGATAAAYNGAYGVSSATTGKTCSNLSCHYFTTPLWSTY